MDDTADDVADALGRAWLDTRPWEFITDLTALGGRMGGSEAEAEAADLVGAALRDAGVRNVRLEPFGMNCWERGRTELELTAPDERSFRALALPYSPAGDVEADLVDVGYGTPEEIEAADVEGKVAVASATTPEGGRFIHRMEKYGVAVERGAEAFVFVNHVPGQLPPTGSLTFNEEAAVPAVGVSKETGAWLTDYAERGGAVRLSVEATTAPGESRNVVGELGPDTDERLVLCAHYDGHDVAEGALDNGCGIATLVAAARILAATDLEVGVTVAGVGCEEVGLIGSERLADELDLGSVNGVVNLDGAGRHRDMVVMTHTSEGMAEATRRLRDRYRQTLTLREEPHPFSDQWPFVREGVPGVQLQSDSGERGRGWGHTEADTRGKVDVRNIREHAMLTALFVDELATADLPRLDVDELAGAFREADLEPGMRAAGLWPRGWE